MEKILGTFRAVASVCALFAVLAAAFGCGKKSGGGAESGIRVAVTVDTNDASGLDGNLDQLVFYVGVATADASGPYVTDQESNGTTADVTGRALLTDPFLRMFEENGDGVMETIKVIVLASRGGAVAAWGWLENPPYETFVAGQVIDRTITLQDASRVPPPFEVTDTGCILLASDGSVIIASRDDRDCDGSPASEDCDDENPNVGPFAREVCDNGIDDDCNGQTDEVVDVDNDGFTNCDPIDCDDGNPNVYPGATELCDGVDNDCNGQCDEPFDADGDRYTDCTDGTGSRITALGQCEQPPDAANWDCDDGSQTVYPGAAEVCDGADNDCNGQTDEQGDVSCYGGPAGTEGIGRCQAGVAACINGILGPCTGQIMPTPEACNLMDDDCNGQTDEGMPTLTCGQGACFASTSSCVNGVLQQCTPGTPAAEDCNDNLDNDCDGLTDNNDPDCACVHVAPFGNDTTGNGTAANPLQTINAGIALATQAGQPKAVCVAAQMSCAWTFYNEDVVMADGISVFGGYNPNAAVWTQSPHFAQNPTCVTEIRSHDATGLYFGPGVTTTTVLDNFAVSIQAANPPATSAAITVEGSTGARISNCAVFGQTGTAASYGIHITEDPNTSTPATPIITRSSVEAGDNSPLAVAIYSYRSAPIISGSCDAVDLDGAGRCTGGCWTGRHIRGYRNGAAARSDVSYAVLLEESPGAFLDQSTLCSRGNTEVAAVKIIGNAAGTIVTRSEMGVWAANIDNGILMEDCGGASPWIADNAAIGAEGNQAGTAVAVGVRAVGDCHPLIEANLRITGGLEGQSNDNRGVLCQRSTHTGAASQCAITANVEIMGSTFGRPASSTGVRCEDGSCAVITDNHLIWGRAGDITLGVHLMGPTNAFIDGNIIRGGCGVNITAAVLADDAAARIQNNVIDGGYCQQGSIAGGDFFGIWMRLSAGANELDIHSNAIDGGGVQNQGCPNSFGVALSLLPSGTPPTAPMGILRNNQIEPGRCAARITVAERDAACDPRYLENNDILWPGAVTALYLDEGATQLQDATSINALTDTTVAANIDLDPQVTWNASGFPDLGSSSPCRNAGTASGAPTWDYQGQPRPLEGTPDIGPDEYHP